MVSFLALVLHGSSACNPHFQHKLALQMSNGKQDRTIAQSQKSVQLSTLCACSFFGSYFARKLCCKLARVLSLVSPKAVQRKCSLHIS